MNRKLRSGGSWDRRNGPKGTGAAWRWDYLNEPLLDTVNLNISFNGFSFTPDGSIPEGAQSDTVNLDLGFQQFYYTPEATNPDGSQTDTVNLDPDIVSFSYTP
jgi:hypothetical protein